MVGLRIDHSIEQNPEDMWLAKRRRSRREMLREDRIGWVGLRIDHSIEQNPEDT